jgi:tetratricopeptide (TPR) repeat protein
MVNLAVTYGHQGHYRKAEGLLAQTIELAGVARSNANRAALQAMVNLASIYGNQGLWKQAEDLFAQVVEARSRLLGDMHPDTVAAMEDLILTYQSQDRLQEADVLRLKVLGMLEGGKEDEDLAKLIDMIDNGYIDA